MGLDHDTLIVRAAGGEATALKLLLTQTFATVRAVVARRIPPDLQAIVDPEDILQDADIEIFRRITDFKDHSADAFVRWRSTIALSRLRNAIKHSRRAKRGGARVHTTTLKRSIEESSVAFLDLVAAQTRTPSKSCVRRENVTELHHAIAELPEQYRQAIWLVHIDGQSVRNAANKIGCTERAIHGLCRRGIRILGERMREDSLSGHS